MATQQTKVVGRVLLTPAVALLLFWMIVPLAMTIYFSTLNYNLLNPGMETFVWFENYYYFLTEPAFFASLKNTLILVGSVLGITIILGTLVALLLDQVMYGQSIVRLMVIAPFFVGSSVLFPSLFSRPMPVVPFSLLTT